MRIVLDACVPRPLHKLFVGYDDIDTASSNQPPLTTVRVDKEGLGREAVMALIDGNTSAGDTLQLAELIVRESSRASS